LLLYGAQVALVMQLQWKNWLDEEDDNEEEENEDREQAATEKEGQLVEEPGIEDKSSSEDEHVESAKREVEPDALEEADRAELRAQQQAWLDDDDDDDDDDSDADAEEELDEDGAEKGGQQPKPTVQNGDLKVRRRVSCRATLPAAPVDDHMTKRCCFSGLAQ
jgi:hypothetical protein